MTNAMDMIGPSNRSLEIKTLAPVHPSLWNRLVRFLPKRELAIPAAFFLFILIVSILAPFVAPYNPTERNVKQRLEGLSVEHLFGTDELGRDVLSRVIF